MRLQCYSVDVDVPATEKTFSVRFPYVKLDQISALYMIWVEDSQRGYGARQTRFQGGNSTDNQELANIAVDGSFPCFKAGSAYQELFCPIKWDTIKISASVKNAVLGNLQANRATTMDMFRVYKTFAGNPDMCYDDWIKFNQCLVFNAQQLGTDVGFGSAFSTITLNVDFQCERPHSDWGLSSNRIGCHNVRVAADAPVINYAANFERGANTGGAATDTNNLSFDQERILRFQPRRYTARLLMFEPEVIALAENSCSVEQIRLQGSAVQQSLISGASLVVSDKIDDLEQYAS